MVNTELISQTRDGRQKFNQFSFEMRLGLTMKLRLSSGFNPKKAHLHFF